jgi:hypothetical protein
MDRLLGRREDKMKIRQQERGGGHKWIAEDSVRK